MGFVWWSEEISPENIKLLVEMQRSQGSARIAHDLISEERTLGRLASQARILRFFDALPTEFVRQLDGIGFDWTLMPSDFSE